MITAGCDIGSRTAKAVILDQDKIIAKAVIPAKLDPVVSAETVMALALEEAGLKLTDIERIIGTGYGQQEVPFAHECESEIVCHARGAWWVRPSRAASYDAPIDTRIAPRSWCPKSSLICSNGRSTRNGA